MKKFDIIKTIQLVLLVSLTVAALIAIVRDRALYAMIAADPHVRMLSIVLWLVLGISFGFLFYDFSSYADLKRENMELDNAIYSDALTGIANRYSVDVYIGRYLNRPLPTDMGCVTIEVTNLKEINDRLGHSGGDAAIQAFADILQSAASGVCFIGRNGGNKFLAIFRECSPRRLEKFAETIETMVAERNAARRDMTLTYGIGVAFDEGEEIRTLTELIALSDRRAWQTREGR